MIESSEQKISSNNTRSQVIIEPIKKKKSSKNIDKYPNKKIIDTISELLNNMCDGDSSTEINNKNIQFNSKIKYHKYLLKII